MATFRTFYVEVAHGVVSYWSLWLFDVNRIPPLLQCWPRDLASCEIQKLSHSEGNTQNTLSIQGLAAVCGGFVRARGAESGRRKNLYRDLLNNAAYYVLFIMNYVSY